LKKHYKEELFGVEYLKIPFTPKEIPSRKEVNRVYDILNKNISKKQYILIHCTHGVNRTGYVLIYFLCKRYEYSVEKAIEIFEKSRGHKFENKAFITDLKQKLK
jgi:atypical dual specificity phosphatase